MTVVTLFSLSALMRFLYASRALDFLLFPRESDRDSSCDLICSTFRTFIHTTSQVMSAGLIDGHLIHTKGIHHSWIGVLQSWLGSLLFSFHTQN
jgi:hypothetical protein